MSINESFNKPQFSDEFINKGLWTGSQPGDLLNGVSLLAYQFYALIVKRFINSIRNKSLIISQLVVPIVILLINLVYLKYAPVKAQDSPALKMTLAKYANNYLPYQLLNNNSQALQLLAKAYQNHVDMTPNSQAFSIEQDDPIELCKDKRASIDNFINCVGQTSYTYYTDNYILAAEFKAINDNKLEVLGYFNNQPYHVPPLSLNLLTSSLYNLYTSSVNRTITVTNHPLPRNFEEQLNDAQLKDPTSFNIVSCLAFGFSFLIASFCIFIIKERTSNSKHLQYLSGCNSYVFWISAFTWDIINYFLSISIVVLLLKV